MLEDLIQYCSIMQDIVNKGREQLTLLKEMKYSCAFQGEIQSGEVKQVKDNA